MSISAKVGFILCIIKIKFMFLLLTVEYEKANNFITYYYNPHMSLKQYRSSKDFSQAPFLIVLITPLPQYRYSKIHRIHQFTLILLLLLRYYTLTL